MSHHSEMPSAATYLETAGGLVAAWGWDANRLLDGAMGTFYPHSGEDGRTTLERLNITDLHSVGRTGCRYNYPDT